MIEMSTIKFYTATKGKKEDTVLYKSLKGIPLHVKENNKDSLQKTYNEFLDVANNSNVDIACLVHDLSLIHI